MVDFLKKQRVQTYSKRGATRTSYIFFEDKDSIENKSRVVDSRVKVKNPFRIYEDLDYQQSSGDEELEEKYAQETLLLQEEDEEEDIDDDTDLASFMSQDDYQCQQYLEFKPTILLL